MINSPHTLRIQTCYNLVLFLIACRARSHSDVRSFKVKKNSSTLKIKLVYCLVTLRIRPWTSSLHPYTLVLSHILKCTYVVLHLYLDDIQFFIIPFLLLFHLHCNCYMWPIKSPTECLITSYVSTIPKKSLTNQTRSRNFLTISHIYPPVPHRSPSHPNRMYAILIDNTFDSWHLSFSNHISNTSRICFTYCVTYVGRGRP